ncbi:hypothetical protein BD410DRAFT_871424 [Rickenella mellea]|uniref:Uncharacterized protein n=1 Tax=Rickenella mellea TaxID=50990 RepID=A0A4Y7Q1R1_9AGAM|nr:hypothetical protein BD410DRAFT_871424 [Rickenella mellea]
MPGRGDKHHKKANRRPKVSSTCQRDFELPFINEIENATCSDSIASILCTHLRLPDLNTRSGLKKVHKSFPEVYERLEDIYTRYFENDRIVVGVVGIYSVLGVDSILNHLMFKKGILSKIFPLCARLPCRRAVLLALDSMSSHGGNEIRLSIATRAATLIELAEQHVDDAEFTNTAISVLVRVALTVLADTQPDAAMVDSLHVPTLLRIVVARLRTPSVTGPVVCSSISLLRSAAHHCSKEMWAFPQAVGLLVASLRSPDMKMRCLALSGIKCLHDSADSSMKGLDTHTIATNILNGIPTHLNNLVMAYGRERTDIFMTLRGDMEYQETMLKLPENRDWYTLGRIIVRIILQTDNGIGDGAYVSRNPCTGEIEDDDKGMPFKMWIDSLPLFATALRALHPDEADVMDCKYLVAKRHSTEAMAMARRAIKRSPHIVFFYYVIACEGHGEEGLQAARNGLRCPTLSSYYRFALLFRAARHAGQLGLQFLQCRRREQSEEEGTDLLRKAWEDAKTVVDEAPPDSRVMVETLYWYNLLSFVLKGPEIGVDLQELDDVLCKLKIADELIQFYTEGPLPDTPLRLMHQLAVQRQVEATAEWGEFLKDLDNIETCRHDGEVDSHSEDDLESYEDLHFHLGCLGERETGGSVQIKLNDSTLYRCSWCRNPSAVLKKCSGCESARCVSHNPP